MISAKECAKQSAIAVVFLVIFMAVSAVFLVIGVNLANAGYGWVACVEALIYLFCILFTSRYVFDNL